MGVEGDVLLRFVVTKRGTVRDAEIRRGLNAELDEAALDEVSRYLYRPATRDGESVNVRILETVRFRLDSSDVRMDDGSLRLADLERTDIGLSGTVLDLSGREVPSATIVRSEGFGSTVTGGDGRFTLVVDASETIGDVRISAREYPSRFVSLPHDLSAPLRSAERWPIRGTLRTLRIVGTTQTERGFVGQVLDYGSGEPVVGASVRVGSTQVESLSDREGRFFLALTDLPPDGTIIVSAPDYDGYIILDINGLIYANREMGRLIPMQTPQARQDAMAEEWRVRFNPMVSLRMEFSQNHYPINIERVDSDCPELDDVALATAQAMRLPLRPGEVERDNYAYLMMGCGNLRGEPIGARARPMVDIPSWVEYEVQNSEQQSAEWPHVLFRSEISQGRRYVSPTVLRSDCPARNDAAMRFVTDEMNLMPSTMESWMENRERPPLIAIGSVPCDRLELD